LLLTFFVLLLSFANMDVQYFQLALGSVKHALGVKTKRPGYMEAKSTTPIEWDNDAAKQSDVQAQQDAIVKIEAIIRQEGLQDTVKLEVRDDSIILKVYGLFAAASAELDPRKFDELSLLVAVCNLFEAPLTVQAHTDNRPIRTERFGSNWALSAMRAGAVARYLAEGGVAESRLAVAGLAHLQPIASNDTTKGRALNRRVAIVIARKRTIEVQETDTAVWK
ncbi:MAG: OmpA family protein, partial [Myxococcota bacterium]